jgi:hypothetical protein
MTLPWKDKKAKDTARQRFAKWYLDSRGAAFGADHMCGGVFPRRLANGATKVPYNALCEEGQKTRLTVWLNETKGKKARNRKDRTEG